MNPRAPSLISRPAASLAAVLAVLASSAVPAFDEPAALPAESGLPPAAAQDGAAPRLRPIPEIDPAQFELPDFFHDSEWLSDPFTAVETDMSSAIADLDDGRTRPPAEFTQPMIIERLDVMIEMLEKACKKAGGSGGGGGPRGANASILRSGKDQRGPMRAVQEDGRKWAELTPQEREKILQSKTDGFPAGYDDILADYFRKLSRGAAEPVNESSDAQ
jgi:hypothetical protein